MSLRNDIPCQGEVNQRAMGITDTGKETVIGWQKCHHTIARTAKSLKDGTDSRYNTAGILNPFFWKGPAMAATVPCTNCLKKSIWNKAIAIKRMGSPMLNSPCYTRSCFEIHVGNPKWKDVIRLGFVPL